MTDIKTELIGIDEKSNRLPSVDEQKRCLKGTMYDNIFGAKSPLREKPEKTELKEWIDAWTEKDFCLEVWLSENKSLNFYGDECLENDLWFTSVHANLIRVTRTHLKEYFELKENKKTSPLCVEHSGCSHSLFEFLERWDITERKYDIPEIALYLRKWNFTLAFEYLIKGGNLEWIKNNWIEITAKYWSKLFIDQCSVSYIRLGLETEITKPLIEWLLTKGYRRYADIPQPVLAWLRDPETNWMPVKAD